MGGLVSHYGEWISAYADGELSRAQVARLDTHLLQCARCARELAEERAARSMLLAARDVAPSDDLTQRLMAAAAAAAQDSSCLTPERRGARARRARDRARVELRTLTPGETGPTFPALTGEVTGRRRNVAVLALAGFVGLSAGAFGLAALGAPPRVVPSAHRAEALATLAHAGGPAAAVLAGTDAQGQVDGDATVAALREAGWHVPVDGAAGIALVDHRWVGAEELELDLAVGGTTIVLRERVGRLDVQSLASAEVRTVAGVDVYVLSDSPWHVAWQVGDLVVESYGAEADIATSTDVVAGTSVTNRFASRVVRGWDTLVTTVAGR